MSLDPAAIVEVFRSRMEQIHARDRAILDRLVEIMRQPVELPPASVASMTQRDRIAELLSMSDRPWTASEIADATGIDPGAVRVTLYGNPDRFEQHRVGPRRVRWSLKQPVQAGEFAVD